ncbi:MAG: hypothetical protein KKF89_06360 [Nanoarchaeota archaeon]|nr:hypothetical protein [Nanoarchaeota archaeon]MBU1855321.1 hypothetical protein [Nanoarchaeota archaeon]
MFITRKKGSLSLSIEAIVILVMAMAVLGLGLGFIRTLIGQGQEQFKVAIENAQLQNPASADNPVTVDTTVRLKVGKSAKMSIGFYNADTSSVDIEPTLGGCNSQLSLVSGKQTVPAGEARGYRGIIKAIAIPSPVINSGDTLVCTVNFGTYGSEQFYVDIIS